MRLERSSDFIRLSRLVDVLLKEIELVTKEHELLSVNDDRYLDGLVGADKAWIELIQETLSDLGIL